MTHSRIGKVKMKNGGAELVIHPSNKFVQSDAVAKLEQALKLARSGEMVSVGVAAVLSDGRVTTCYSDETLYNIIGSVAAIELLKDRVIRLANG